MNRRQFLRWLPGWTCVVAMIDTKFDSLSRPAFETVTDHEGWWGVPGAVYQLVTHEFGQTWMRFR